MGLVTMLDTVLLFGAGYSRANIETRVPNDWLSISHSLFQILTGLCALDLPGIQVLLSNLEFYVSRWTMR